MHICLDLDDAITPWRPTNRTDLVVQRFFGF